MSTLEIKQDFFISHASKDKEPYIKPLTQELSRRGVTYWLDTIEMSWGDQLSLEINKGLATTKYILLCLSKDFLNRSWPQTEMNTALTMQNNEGTKKVLPLILNSKEIVLQKYPIIGGLVYKEFSEGVDIIGKELATLSTKPTIPEGHIHVAVESIHTGQLLNVTISPRVSINWLIEKARLGAGLKYETETGGFEKFPIRWVLVDSKADEVWKNYPRSVKRSIQAIVLSNEGLLYSSNRSDRLERLNIYDGIIFHLYAIEDEGLNPPQFCC